jgi:hypothetical protein
MDQSHRGRRRLRHVVVNGIEVRSIAELKASPHSGAVGPFVDIGSESVLSNLIVSPSRHVGWCGAARSEARTHAVRPGGARPLI